MKAIKELIDYFISRGTFSEEEIIRMKELGYLQRDPEIADLNIKKDILTEDLDPELQGDDDLSLEEKLIRKRVVGKSKSQKKNHLTVKDLDHDLGERLKTWQTKINGLFELLSHLNDQNRELESISIESIEKDRIKSIIIKYLRQDPDFIISLWSGISFDDYIGLFSDRSGTGYKIYKMICRGDNLLNLSAFRFGLKYYNIRLLQCIVLLQRLALKAFREIFSETPDQVLNFLRRTQKMDIINAFLLFDIVSNNLLEINHISCFIIHKPLREKVCQKFNTAANGGLFTWGLDKNIYQWNLMDYSKVKVDNIYTEPEFCINPEANKLAYYLVPAEQGKYKTISKIFIFKKKDNNAALWHKWKTRKIDESGKFKLIFHPDGSRLLMFRTNGQHTIWDFNKNKITNYKTGEELVKLSNIEFSPDRKTFYIAGVKFTEHKTMTDLKRKSRKEISAYSFPEFDKLLCLPSRIAIKGISLSADGQHIAYFGESSKIIVYNLISSKLITLTGHSGLIRSVSFGSYNDILASASVDETIRLWYLATGECFEILDLNKEITCLKGENEKQAYVIKLSLLKNNLIYHDDRRGLIIFKINILKETSFSWKDRYMNKWVKYFGDYKLNRIDFDRKDVFNAVIMDEGKNRETYNQLINNEVKSLICIKLN